MKCTLSRAARSWSRRFVPSHAAVSLPSAAVPFVAQKERRFDVSAPFLRKNQTARSHVPTRALCVCATASRRPRDRSCTVLVQNWCNRQPATSLDQLASVIEERRSRHPPLTRLPSFLVRWFRAPQGRDTNRSCRSEDGRRSHGRRKPTRTYTCIHRWAHRSSVVRFLLADTRFDHLKHCRNRCRVL